MRGVLFSYGKDTPPMRYRLLALLLAALVLALPGHAAPRFVPLGYLPGDDFSYASGVSADGSTVVGASGGQAFRWTSGDGMVGLGFLPDGYATRATAVSGDGSTVVGESMSANASPQGQAFRWTSGDGMVGLGFLLPRDLYSSANGVSADGSVIVGQAWEAFRWTSGDGMVGLGFLPGGNISGAHGVSADGSIVVGGSSGSGWGEAFRWTSGDGMVGLGWLPGDSESSVSSVSADGSTVVGNSRNEEGQAFRWTSGDGMVGLGFLPGGHDSYPTAVSGDGSTVVGETSAGAFTWDATHGMRDLNQVLTGLGLDLTGWTLRDAHGISADGQTIVGTGTNPAGQQEAWFAVVPEPAQVLLVLTGGLVLAGVRRRRVQPEAAAHDAREPGRYDLPPRHACLDLVGGAVQGMEPQA